MYCTCSVLYILAIFMYLNLRSICCQCTAFSHCTAVSENALCSPVAKCTAFCECTAFYGTLPSVYTGFSMNPALWGPLSLLTVHGSCLMLHSPSVVYSVVQLVILLHSKCTAFPHVTDSMVLIQCTPFAWCTILISTGYVVHLLSVYCTLKKCTAFFQCTSFFGPTVVSVQQSCCTAVL